jgi:predicted GNAT family acetyltransferase
MAEIIEVINNIQKSRFEVHLDDDIATLDYRHYKNDIAFMHTAVPEKFKGKGVGSMLVFAALAFVRKQNKKLMLYCPFASKYVKEHPEYYDLVDTDYHQSFLSK